MRTGGMDPSRGKRKNRTLPRGRSSRPVQKTDDIFLPAVREKAAPKNLDSKGKQFYTYNILKSCTK